LVTGNKYRAEINIHHGCQFADIFEQLASFPHHSAFERSQRCFNDDNVWHGCFAT
jgi:hypothetical protein